MSLTVDELNKMSIEQCFLGRSSIYTEEILKFFNQYPNTAFTQNEIKVAVMKSLQSTTKIDMKIYSALRSLVMRKRLSVRGSYYYVTPLKEKLVKK